MPRRSRQLLARVSSLVEIRLGWSVAIVRDDGSRFLSHGDADVAPVFYGWQVWRRIHEKKAELEAHGFKCRVVRVAFGVPTEVRK